ncbi:hypothetical protein AT03_02900 [Hafnia alvei FB1]|uniref:Uncharacterized protein n=1 Tax=Hafnia alvei FB1 TaxID=1453496 RepID=A0A097QY65_HAFAL|nr:hypothetical protein AT03_02900 [Hafnia alvei FB1]
MILAFHNQLVLMVKREMASAERQTEIITLQQICWIQSFNLVDAHCIKIVKGMCSLVPLTAKESP